MIRQPFSAGPCKYLHNYYQKNYVKLLQKNERKKNTTNVGVSVDRTWQRKGFTSLNGVITAISIDSGKVLDVAILSKSCKDCSKMQAILAIDPPAYNKWNATRKRGLNYKGSALAMEKLGAEKIFKQSVTKNNFYYTSFGGDGDSNAFPAVENAYRLEKPVKKSKNALVTTRNGLEHVLERKKKI